MFFARLTIAKQTNTKALWKANAHNALGVASLIATARAYAKANNLQLVVTVQYQDCTVKSHVVA
jgi:hypothetical protein